MRTLTILAVIAGATATTFASAALAQEPGSRQTREFVQAAAQSDQFEILEGQTVLAESQDPAIRSFAQQMIQAHTDTSRTLTDAASRAGLQPPPKGLANDQSQMLAALQSLRGRAFDQAYLRQQALAHRAALIVQQTYAATGDDTVLRQVAASTTPLIASHLKMAEQMQAGASGS